MGYCYECLQQHWDEVRNEIFALHAKSRMPFDLPPEIPRTKDGIKCHLCANACQITSGEVGFCGVRKNVDGRLVGASIKGNLRFYYDPLPTNCVADWVCPASTGAGYPKYACLGIIIWLCFIRHVILIVFIARTGLLGKDLNVRIG